VDDLSDRFSSVYDALLRVLLRHRPCDVSSGCRLVGMMQSWSGEPTLGLATVFPKGLTGVKLSFWAVARIVGPSRCTALQFSSSPYLLCDSLKYISPSPKGNLVSQPKIEVKMFHLFSNGQWTLKHRLFIHGQELNQTNHHPQNPQQQA
jgi:hypothetical protein